MGVSPDGAEPSADGTSVPPADAQPPDGGGPTGSEASPPDAPPPDAEPPPDGGDRGDASDDAATPLEDGGTVVEPYLWDLPPGFPVPAVPGDNPMTEEKVELGRYLFYDTRLSDNQTQSCASCHVQELAFTDGLARSIGSTGQTHPRSAMSLANVGYNSTQTWGHPLMTELERQALVPMFGTEPVELGLKTQAQIEERLRAVALYEELFAAAFPESEAPVTLGNATKAIASFERTLISGRSPFDRWQYEGDATAISDAAKRGYALFNSEKMECFHCHLNFNLTDHAHYEGKAFFEKPFHNTGLYAIDGKGAYPEPNTGVYSVTGNPKDMGKFKAPTLRNIAVTAPYMHDGSIATLSEVLDHYVAGGRTIDSGPNAGNGSRSLLKDPLIRAFELTEQERADVIAFLESLTDEEFLTDPRFSNPWLSGK